MVIVLIVLLGGIALYNIHRNMLMKKELRNINEQIELKNKQGSNCAIINKVELRDMKRLTKNLNETFDEMIVSKIMQEKKEQESQAVLSHLAHDIRTPITSLKGYVKLLQEGVSKDKEQQYLEIISSRITFLSSMIDNIFTFSKLSDPNYQITLKRQSVHNELCKSLSLFYNEFQQVNMEPIMEFDNPKIEYLVNKELLGRIFNNLISNAIKYGCGPLEIKQKGNKIIFANQCKNDNLEIDKIFDRFYKEDPSRGLNKSSGLGLSIVKSIMIKFKGNVSAELCDGKLYICLQFSENFA